MKKDYILVDESNFLLDDAAFSASHWNKYWKEKKTFLTNKIPNFERDEKYKIIMPYILKLSAGNKILDGGCGRGKWTRFFHSKGFETTGLDFDSETIKELSKHFPEINFVHGDIRNLSFQDEHFDAYFSWGAFEHFEEGLGSCFKEAYRVLKPHGYLFITVPFQNKCHIKRDLKPLHLWDRDFNREKGYTSKMRFYQWRLTTPELQKEMEMHGFKTLEIRPIHKKLGFRYVLKQDFGITRDSIFYKLARLIYPFIPKSKVAHMLIGISQKDR